MEKKLEIIFNYDFDPEQGYTQKSLVLDRNEWAICESMLERTRRVIVNLYPEDIAKILEGTGVDLDEV